jgi:ATP-dependent DNA helicase RecQ
MSNLREILLKYWGYSQFRPLQEEIIESVVKGNDTLALMPTGGGKSIIFQVAALASEGLCIVVTPLIALMNDQVLNLQKRKISAIAISSSLTNREIDLAFDKCIFGNVKFLYLSPERLHSDLFLTKIKQMKVNLLAIDEAHCISQWGYDFRPSYLRIAEIRKEISDIPVVALTASATKEVAKDIMEKLNFKKENVFTKSFERKNLVYHIEETEKKYNYLLRIINNVKGTGVVYTRNRRKTKEVALFLYQNKISADYYHAGLDSRIRNKKQDDWISGKTRIIVATNAFGMGIDKPDVRFVVHLDIPDSLEAYYQEAGRGGRDEKKAFAVLLYEKSDILNLQKNTDLEFPSEEYIKLTYKALCNYFNIPIGSGKNTVHEFNFKKFCDNYNLKPLETFNSIKILEQVGLVQLTDAFYNPSKLMFLTNKTNLYEFQVANSAFDNFIKLILRTYSGVFSDYTHINEEYLAQIFKVDKSIIIKYLNTLKQYNIIDYLPETNSPKITFIEERLAENNNFLNYENFGIRKERYIKRVESVINYVTSTAKCRSQIILEYFGETNSVRCGTCDVCKRRNELELSKYEFDIILEILKKKIREAPVSLNYIVENISYPDYKVIKVIEWLFENNKIKYNEENNLIWLK